MSVHITASPPSLSSDSGTMGEKKGATHVEEMRRTETEDSAFDNGRSEKLGGLPPADGKEEPMTLHRFMPLVAMAFLWTGSQIPLYLFGAVPPYSESCQVMAHTLGNQANAIVKFMQTLAALIDGFGSSLVTSLLLLPSAHSSVRFPIFLVAAMLPLRVPVSL